MPYRRRWPRGQAGLASRLVDSTIIRTHYCAVGIKRLKLLKPSVVRGVASRPKSIPGETGKAGRSASRSRRARRIKQKGFQPCCR